MGDRKYFPGNAEAQPNHAGTGTRNREPVPQDNGSFFVLRPMKIESCLPLNAGYADMSLTTEEIVSCNGR